MVMELGIDSTVFVEDVAITADIGVDCFGRSGKPQPVLVSAYILFDFSAASKDDDFTKALDYRGLNKAIKSSDGYGDEKKTGLDGLVTAIVVAIAKITPNEALQIRVRCHAPKAIMHCDGGLTIDHTFTRQWFDVQPPAKRVIPVDTYIVDKLRVVCIIGIGKEERVIKQPVLISFEITHLGDCDDLYGIQSEGVKTLANNVHELVSKTAYQTIEAMIEHVYTVVVDFCEFKIEPDQPHCAHKIKLKISKPAVFAGAAGPGVQIVRTTKALAGPREQTPASIDDDSDDSEESVKSEDVSVKSEEISVKSEDVSDAKPPTKKRKTR